MLKVTDMASVIYDNGSSTAAFRVTTPEIELELFYYDRTPIIIGLSYRSSLPSVYHEEHSLTNTA